MTRTAAGMDFELAGAEPTDGAPVMVLLHGRGSNRHDLPGLAPHLPSGVVVVSPDALHPGQPWGYGPGRAWYRYVAEDRIVEETLARSLDVLDAFLTALPGELGAEPGRLALGGFSQGGTTSLAYAITRPGSVDAVMVFSGFLVDAPSVVPLPDEGPILDGVPVFWGHGTRDPAIPFALGEKGRARLRELGVDLTTGDYPTGHGIVGEELEDVRRWWEARST